MSDTRFFRKIVNGDRQTTQLQTNIEQAVAQVIRNPLIDGRIIEGVVLSTSALKIEHKLGRKVRGYIVLTRNANAEVYDNVSTEPQLELYLPLLASAPVTVNLWVF